MLASAGLGTIAWCLVLLGQLRGSLVFTLLLCGLLGVGAALLAIPAQTTIQEDTPEAQRGKVFGLQNNLINIALSLPLVLAGTVVSRYGLLPVLWGLAAIAPVAALLSGPGGGLLAARHRCYSRCCVCRQVMHIAWLGKKSPFCGNVTYGLSTTEALRQRGHAVSFIHFDTPAREPSGRADGAAAISTRRWLLPLPGKSQVYTIPSPGAQRELRESLERLRPDLVHASLTLSPLDFRLPDLCQQLGLPLVATFHPPFDAGAAQPQPQAPSSSPISSMPPRWPDTTG